MNEARTYQYSLLTVITERGKGRKAASIAKEKGVLGATIILGWGTSRSPLLNMLDLGLEDRDIVYMASDPETIDSALAAIKDEMHLEKPHHGIAIVRDLAECCGIRHNKEKPGKPKGDENMKELITIVVDRGVAEDVIDAAKKAGATGGTIINARGFGARKAPKIFDMEVASEKEMILIVSNSDKTDAIMSKIEEDLALQSPGKGIMYLQPVTKSIGLRR